MISLYRVTLRGMQNSYGVSYVVAHDPGEAYKMVRKALADDSLGRDADRVLDKVELLAEAYKYTDCGTILYLPQESAK